MQILAGILIGLVSIGLVKERKGGWYEYLAAIILTMLLCFGLLFL